jgi:hypothetical protein
MTGKEPRSICYRYCRWMMSYEIPIDNGFGTDAGTLAGISCVYTAPSTVQIEEGSRYFCESLFWVSQPKQAAKT